jgi:hypothetical protein
VNWDFVRREWGAVTFILTVLVGIVVVPLALYLANQGPGPLVLPPPNTASSAASSARTSPSPSTSPSAQTSPSPSKSP